MRSIDRTLLIVAAASFLVGAKAPADKIVEFNGESQSALFVVVHPVELSKGMLEFHFREYDAGANEFESIRMGRNGSYSLGRRELNIPQLAARGFRATAHMVPASLRVPSIIRADFEDSRGFKATQVHCFRDSTPVFEMKPGQAYYLEMFDSENLERRREGVATGITRDGKLALVDVRRTPIFDSEFDDEFDDELFEIVRAHVATINGTIDLNMARPKYRLVLKGERGRATEFATESGCSEVRPDKVTG